MANLDTVKIRAGKGYVEINKTDFDPKKGHKLFAETKPVKKAAE